MKYTKEQQEAYQKGKFTGLMEATRIFNEKNAVMENYDETVYAKAALATIRKMYKIMHEPAYKMNSSLNKYLWYLVKTYHLEEDVK